MTARARARTPRAPAPLTPDRICAAALGLIDAHGLDAFSTRKLGEALGCEAMAIYWHFPNKEALLDAVGDDLMAGVAGAVVDDGEDWVATLREVAHAYRRIARDHPRAFPLLATRRFTSEATHRFVARLFALARRHRVPERTVARLFRIVSSFCSGFALNELAVSRGPAVSRWLEPEHSDDIFDAGLDLLLAPLTAKRRAR